ncbi:hypothetical protein C5B85_00045 [Pseudoclavibacter sp. AY1F1]|nr:hypothetical protein C5B85_00045 [Pseudoclavibacter sp. AY1F1]
MLVQWRHESPGVALESITKEDQGSVLPSEWAALVSTVMASFDVVLPVGDGREHWEISILELTKSALLSSNRSGRG